AGCSRRRPRWSRWPPSTRAPTRRASPPTACVRSRSASCAEPAAFRAPRDQPSRGAFFFLSAGPVRPGPAGRKAPGLTMPPMDTPLPQNRLRITEIFLSLQGEADTVGWPTVFVRLTGCPLRCQYCDTAYAFHGGQWWDIDAILAEVARHGVRHVCVTGGEPLAQKRCLDLLRRL